MRLKLGKAYYRAPSAHEGFHGIKGSKPCEFSNVPTPSHSEAYVAISRNLGPHPSPQANRAFQQGRPAVPAETK